MWKPAKNPKVEELTKSHRERSITLDCLKAIKISLPTGKAERWCAWCTEGQLHHGSQKYCSEECSNSAMAWAYPQKENALGFLLERQEWKCVGCQFDYKPLIDAMLARERQRYGNTFAIDKMPWYYFKRLKEIISADRKPEVDHIIPVYKGGITLGLANHQVLCFTCHKAKSKVDNSGPRKKDK